MKNNLKAPLPLPTGKPEISDGVSWFTLATENWVLNNIGRVPACDVSTTINLSATYVNGTSGVGATLTNSGTQAGLVIDAVTLVVGNRVLVKDQTASLQNGVYIVTDVGSITTNWVLTRAVDFDSSSQIIKGNLVDVIAGTKNSVSAWMITSSVSIVGTDSIVFTRLSKSSFDNILGTPNQIVVTIANDIATISIATDPILPGVGSVKIPAGTTLERPVTQIAGMLRFNNSL